MVHFATTNAWLAATPLVQYLIVPMLDAETVLLIREYSAGVHRYEVGLPKGKTDPGESFLEAANRELKEEVGFGARKLHHWVLSPWRLLIWSILLRLSSLRIYMPKNYPVMNRKSWKLFQWKLRKINDLLATGECTEARSIAALFMTLEYFKNYNLQSAPSLDSSCAFPA